MDLAQGRALTGYASRQFVGQADQKIQQCVGSSQDPERVVEEICGPGVDLQFDQLISALGHIVRQKPKPLIDTLMLWRKAKSEAATNARAEANQVESSALGAGCTSSADAIPTVKSKPAAEWSCTTTQHRPCPCRF